MISSSLFHFTTFESLAAILQSRRILAGINFEDVRDIIPDKKLIAIPMICFCDIPLKFIDNHAATYGNFGIGFSKIWAQKNKINPILYRMPKSKYSEATSGLIEKVNQLQIASNNIQQLVLASGNDKVRKAINISTQSIVSELTHIQKLTLAASHYTKVYKDAGREPKGIHGTFYSEREWRYVSGLENFDPIIDNFSKSKMDKLKIKYRKTNPDSLYFALSDIEHIVVHKKSDLEKMINLICENFNSGSSNGSMETLKLIQRIVDLETVKSDM